MAFVNYVQDRLKTLKPTLDFNVKRDDPIRLFLSLKPRQWGYFLVGFFAWSWDAFDFHSVTITYAELSTAFGRTATEISVGVTLVLLFRPLGAAIFGLAADRYGRKWPFIINNILLVVFELATGFCYTYQQFLAVRSLFGFAMGGMYGNAAATALEDVPESAKGLMSGIFQSGFPFGYLLAVVFWKVFDEQSRYGWRVLFWFGAVPPIFLIIARLFMCETDTYQDRSPQRGSTPSFYDVLEDIKLALKRHWIRLSYLSLLMAGFSFMSHGTQDLYALMLRNKYGFDSSHITLIQVTANIGAFIGGTLAGYCSQIFGRRFTIDVACIFGGAFLYAYTFSSGSGLYAAVFFEQFCVQGAFGVVPIHLIELSPAAFRTFVVGTSYNLGILIASASNSIETAIGERYPLPSVDGTAIYDYSLVICIFAAWVFAYVILVTSLGPESKGVTLRKDDDDEDFEMSDTVSGPGAMENGTLTRTL
ncbi:MFS general substrate transporter [Melanomma pulvis-pyrius CBS 109.77]|uniref:MFS general substrate transporter n=1 Tax=Melanomma pulvis-pyrius CBS 109.77 TaxID=1314802 RepID=A0A6A6XMX6_9PLEO|nr:MFS general substrate transporter [Melanomma pulvis-pyrius CBS 109.77]